MLQFTLSQVEAWLGQFIWPFVRVLALFMAAPVLSHRSIPARTKIGFALAVAVLLVPALPRSPAVELFGPGAWALLVEQILVGLAVGFSLQIVFAAAALAGDAIGLQMGLGFATFIDPQTSAQTPIVGTLFTIVASLLFLAMDGHLLVIAALVDTFELIPIGESMRAEARWEHFASLGTRLFALGLQIAMPVLVTMLICNVALGVMARATPQLNLFSVGFPLTIVAGLLLIVLFLPFLTVPMEAALREAMQLWR